MYVIFDQKISPLKHEIQKLVTISIPDQDKRHCMILKKPIKRAYLDLLNSVFKEEKTYQISAMMYFFCGGFILIDFYGIHV